MKKLLLITIILLLQSFPSYSNTKYPFTLKVISEDKEIANVIEKKINQSLNQFNNMEIDNNEHYRNIE